MFKQLAALFQQINKGIAELSLAMEDSSISYILGRRIQYMTSQRVRVFCHAYREIFDCLNNLFVFLKCFLMQSAIEAKIFKFELLIETVLGSFVTKKKSPEISFTLKSREIQVETSSVKLLHFFKSSFTPCLSFL